MRTVTRVHRFGRASAGISLVELLVGVAVGLLLLVGLSSVYVTTAKGGRTTTQVNQLSQDMRAVMDIMVNDIRRAGFWGAPADGVPNPFTAAATSPTIVQNGNLGCILYAYDATYIGGSPNVVDSGVDIFGFRLNSQGVLGILRPGSNLANTASSGCSNTAIWESLTDERAIEVTALSFDTIGSQCMALVPGVYDPTEVPTPPAEPVTYKAWESQPASPAPTTWPCDTLPAGFALTAAHQRIETRQVNITLTARSRTDTTLPALTLSESVLIRNNRVILPP